MHRPSSISTTSSGDEVDVIKRLKIQEKKNLTEEGTHT